MLRQSDKPQTIKTTNPQTVELAGTIGSTSESFVGESRGRYALSTSASTTITNAQNLYPELWNRAPAGWQSGSDLVVPAQRQVISESGSGSITVNEAGYVISDAEWRASRSGDIVAVDLRFVLNWTSPADTTPTLSLNGFPSWLSFNQGNGDLAKGIVIPINDSSTGFGITTVFPRNQANISVYRTAGLGGFVGSGSISTGHGGSLGKTVSFSFTSQDFGSFDTTPYIHLYDSVAAGALGLPEASASSPGQVTRAVSGSVAFTSGDATEIVAGNGTYEGTIFYELVNNSISVNVVFNANGNNIFTIKLPQSLILNNIPGSTRIRSTHNDQVLRTGNQTWYAGSMQALGTILVLEKTGSSATTTDFVFSLNSIVV